MHFLQLFYLVSVGLQLANSFRVHLFLLFGVEQRISKKEDSYFLVVVVVVDGMVGIPPIASIQQSLKSSLHC